MQEVKIPYNTISPKRQEYRDRLQLLSASFGIIVGFMETLQIFTGIAILIPIAGLLVAIVNVVMAKYYKTLLRKYGEKLELHMTRLNGVMMLITGLGFQYSGSKYIQYAYYFLAISFFVILPNFLLPAKKKRYFIQFTSDQIIINRVVLKPIVIAWKAVEWIAFQDGVLLLKAVGKKKARKRYLQNENVTNNAEIIDFLKMIKTENEYTFELKVNPTN